MANEALKGIIETAFDLVNAGASLVKKEEFVTGALPDLYDAVSGVPDLVKNAPNLAAEIAALKDPANQSDLVAYVIAEVAGVTSDEHAKKVISAVLIAVEHVVADVIAITEAVKSPA